MTPEERTRRLLALYEKQTEIIREIRGIESQVAAENDALRLARNKAAEAGLKVSRARRAECGTDGGYYRHRRKMKEQACKACKLAHRVAENQRAQRRKEKVA